MSRDPRRLVLRTTCPVCKKTEVFDVAVDEFACWRSGVTIRESFPGFSSDQAHQLATGRHPQCRPDEGRRARRRRFRRAA